jgi:hypothetical protein
LLQAPVASSAAAAIPSAIGRVLMPFLLVRSRDEWPGRA